MASDRTAVQEVKHKRAVQGALSIGTATIGLAALGSKGASMALKKYPKALKAISGKSAPKPIRSIARRVTPESANQASLTLTTTGAGLGGLSGYHFAALQQAENKAERGKTVKKSYSAFGIVHKAERHSVAEGAGLGLAGTGALAAIASPDISHVLRQRSKSRLRSAEKAMNVSDKNALSGQAVERELRLANISGDKARIKSAQKAASDADKTIKSNKPKAVAAEFKAATKSAKSAKRMFSTGKVAAASAGVSALGVGGAAAAHHLGSRKPATKPVTSTGSGWWGA